MTYIFLDSYTVSGSVSSVTFSSIVQDYQDLVIIGSNIATSNNGQLLELNFNNNNSQIYDEVFISYRKNFTGYLSQEASNTAFRLRGELGTGTNASLEINVFNYSTLNATKEVNSLIGAYNPNDNNEMKIQLLHGSYPSSTPITELKLEPTSGTLDAGSFYLYGIEA